MSGMSNSEEERRGWWVGCWRLRLGFARSYQGSMWQAGLEVKVVEHIKKDDNPPVGRLTAGPVTCAHSF